MSHILYRDDDPSVTTCPHLFKQLHDRFIAKKTDHYVGLIMKDLWTNHALFWYLATAPHLIPCIHGWEHKDYSKLSYDECYNDLLKSYDYWKENSERMIGSAKEINIFFAPWNRRGDNIIKACADLGLKFCDVKDGLWEGRTIVSFHWWNVMDDNFKLNV